LWGCTEKRLRRKKKNMENEKAKSVKEEKKIDLFLVPIILIAAYLNIYKI
jgi:hypothetical protein